MYTNEVVEPYDFSEALTLDIDERFRRCIEKAKDLVTENGYQEIRDFPCLPITGGTQDELATMEATLGCELPPEYRRFLAKHRYLKIDDGLEIGGLDHVGVGVTERPWISEEHQRGKQLLVFAAYWRFADGDQLMFDMTEESYPVIAYLHEHGPLFELYAPSFSLALWRLVHEGE